MDKAGCSLEKRFPVHLYEVFGNVQIISPTPTAPIRHNHVSHGFHVKYAAYLVSRRLISSSTRLLLGLHHLSDFLNNLVTRDAFRFKPR